jgi:hypothetical protein
MLQPGALLAVGVAFAGEDRPDVVGWRCRMGFPDSEILVAPTADQLRKSPFGNPIPQPSCFYRRALAGSGDLVRNDLHYVMDLELWCRLRTPTSKWSFLEGF